MHQFQVCNVLFEQFLKKLKRLVVMIENVLKLNIFQVLSGKYPTKSYYSTYDPMTDSLESVEDFGTEADRAILETIRKHGKKCNSVCCTGAFIIEVVT